MTQIAYFNGSYVPLAEVKIPASDRGFRFGDGVFETIRISQHVPYQWELHKNRLQQGLDALRITYSSDGLQQVIETVITKNHIAEGSVRIAISRGGGSRGYLPAGDGEPTIVVEGMTSRPDIPECASLWLSAMKKPSVESLPVHAKTAQGLNATLARLEAQDHNTTEALLLNTHDYISEAASGNIFWVKDKILFTPSLVSDCLPGTIRDTVLRLSPYPLQQGLYPLEQLAQADEVFMTNTLWLILPVCSLQPCGYHWDVGSVTQEIAQLVSEDITHYATHYHTSMD